MDESEEADMPDPSMEDTPEAMDPAEDGDLVSGDWGCGAV